MTSATLPFPPSRRVPILPGTAPEESDRIPASPRHNSVTMNVEHEVNLLVEEIKRLGSKNTDGNMSVKFGVLFSDDRCANIFEALVGTLRAAKRKKIVSFEGELLLQGVHDNVDVILLKE